MTDEELINIALQIADIELRLCRLEDAIRIHSDKRDEATRMAAIADNWPVSNQ